MMTKESLNKDYRLKLFIVTFIFSLIASWGYFSYLVPTWGYFGLQDAPQSIDKWFLSIFFSCLPCLFLPIQINRPSMFVVWILYYLTYIPMIIGVCFDIIIHNEERWLICTTFCVGFLLLCFFYKLKLFIPVVSELPSKYFWTFYYFILFVMFAHIVILFKDNLTFANIFSSEEVYDLRFEGRKIEEKSAIAGYLILWLSNSLFPFVLSVGIVNGNRLKILIGIVGLVILYMTMANKQYVFSILYLFLLHKLFFSNKSQKILIFASTITFLVMLLLLLSKFINIDGINEVVFILSGIVLLRTVYTSTVMSVYYNSFFENHPYTYFSHLSGVNKFVEYPYKNALGIEVGSYFTTFENYNANANFFITDGLSTIGLPGVLLMGLLASFIFYIYDSFATRNNLAFSTLLISSSAIALMNVSMFTTLISGGLIFYIYLINNKKISNKSYS
jgi:hypothetical protein